MATRSRLGQRRRGDAVVAHRFALFVPAFFLPMIRPKWLKALVLLFPVAMISSLVYFGEHWVIDGIVGALIVGLVVPRVEPDRASPAPHPGGACPSAHRHDRGSDVLTPPSVLLDDSFLAALLDRYDEFTAAAHERYAELVSQFERNDLRLRARHDHLGQLPPGARRSFLAPVETVYVAAQHHRAARRLELPFEAEHDVAVTLVIMRREGIEQVASFRPEFELLDVTVHR